ncbi:MAG: hypothetical protein RLZZ502_750 [Pseudomonadota bacterium]|jgi:cobalt-zinc-cadmium efflux system membrane fusion protein
MKKTLLFLCVLMSACQQETANTKAVRPPEPIVQGEQLRFPAGHPQLVLLGITEARGGSDSSLELPARLVWNETRTQRVYPALAGRIATLNVDVGQTVKPGQTLASLTSPDLGQVQAELAKANADLHLNKQQLARQQSLLELGIIARKDLEQAQAENERAQAEQSRASSKVMLYGAGKELSIKSQLAGVVVERNANPGQELRPEQYGPQSPAMFVISDPTSLWVAIDLPEKNASALKVGMPFTLRSASLPGKSFDGSILSVSDQIDPVTRFLKVRGQIANPERQLKAEMLTQVSFALPKAEGVFVPATAVVFGNNVSSVFVQRVPGVFVQKPVILGAVDSKHVQIVNGLAVGEQVVNDNVLLLARLMAQKKEGN